MNERHMQILFFVVLLARGPAHTWRAMRIFRYEIYYIAEGIN
jgi:hypothetical protein